MSLEITTSRLAVSFERSGPPHGAPLFLVHGWPDSFRTWDSVLPDLHAAGFETIVPELRGYGGTRFLDAATPRSGETVALARDLIELADALGIERFGLVGHDWGTRAVFDAAILAPDRIDFAVALSLGWWPASAGRTVSWAQKQAFWYQWYLATPHGADAFRHDPSGFCRRLWDTWSPAGWYDEAAWQSAAAAFQGPDWCDVVIHYYRARWGQAEPDPFYAADATRVREAHAIKVPTMILHGLADTCCLPELSEECDGYFPGGFARVTLDGVGHFPQREAPAAVARHIVDWARMAPRNGSHG